MIILDGTKLEIEKPSGLLTHSHTMTPFDAPGRQAV